MSATVQREKKSLFGFFKNIFRKSDAAAVSADDGVRVVGATPVAPPRAQVPVAKLVSSTNGVSNSQAQPSATASPAQGNGVTLPLQSVLSALPVELRNQVRIKEVGDLSVTIPFEKILSQLSSGVVKIPFCEIRAAVPQAFSKGIEGDMVPVTLPLNDILSRINPTLLMRRPAQRVAVEIPDEIVSPFEGKNLSAISVGNAKPVTPAAPRKAAPSPTTSGRGFSPAAPSAAPRAAAPAKPADAPKPAPAQANSSAVSDDLDSIPSLFTTASPSPAATVQAYSKPAQAAAAKAAPQSVAARVAEELFIPVALKALIDGWPEPLRQEILQQNLVEAKLALPVDPIETSLKRGRVAFPWKLVRSWIRPATAPMVSVHDAVEVELPLRVLAPLFVSRQRAGKFSQQVTATADEIPDVFFGSPSQSSAAVAAPAYPPVVTPAIPVGLPVAAANPTSVSAHRTTDTNYFEKSVNTESDTTRLHMAEIARTGPTGTEFVTRYATPNEIVSRAAALEGIAGALIALPDGLMVASRIPSDLNGDTLAAFLPQLFAKMTACTKELRMGELNNLNFTVGNVPWKIFRVNAIFFAAFGRPNKPMPSAQLASLAGELDRKNK